MVKALDMVMSFLKIVLKVMLLLAVVFIGLQVIFRYVLNSPLMWTEQTCRFLFIWMMLFALPVLFYEKNFLAFDVLTDAMPYRARSILSILSKLFACIFCVCWFIGATQLIMATYKKMTPGVVIPYYLLYGAQNVSAVLVFWVMGNQMVESIKELIHGWKTKGEVE